MIIERLTGLMDRLTHNTVLGELLVPVEEALTRVHPRTARRGPVLSMPDFIALGVLRHIQGMSTLREQVQSLLHLQSAASPQTPPLARSTWADALASPSRGAVLEGMLPPLVAQAREALPDRLAGIPGLGARRVRAIDGTYQRESAHFHRRTPKQGGKDNPKGHALLSFYDVRLGCPEDVYVDTRSRHETALLRDYDQTPHATTRDKGVLWLVDRAFIDAGYWDAKKTQLKSTLITRMKRGLSVNSTEGLPIVADACNKGVIKDLRVTLASSPEYWRLITFRTRRGRRVQFLTNDFDLQPGVIAFLYSRRWDEEKCFDTWKNDFSQAKAWGKSVRAIENQTRLAIVTSVLLAMFMQHATAHGGQDVKALEKQNRRQVSCADGTDRPDWTRPLFRHTSKLSRQVLRFFKHCFHKPASQALFQSQLEPMLMAYL